MSARILYRGTKEYLRARITSTETLDGVVEFSYDRTTWLTAAWEDATPATTRVARLLVDLTGAGAPTASGTLWVRLSDTPEFPVIDAGHFTVA